MMDLSFMEKNTRQALKDLAESLAELKNELTHLTKEPVESVSEIQMSEAEKIVWNHQMELFLLDLNIIVTATRVDIYKKYKLGGTE